MSRRTISQSESGSARKPAHYDAFPHQITTAGKSMTVLLVDMVPKKKQTCHRDSFDRARFLNEDGQNFFLNKYQHRSVVPGRIVMYNELHDTDFCLWMQQRGWFTLYDVGYHIVVNRVREFCSNMHDISDDSFKTYVRGQELDITPDLLSQVLEIDRIESAHFPIMKNRQINYNLVAKELTGKPVAWVGGDMAHHKLTESYRLLNIFIRHNVSPKVSKRVTIEDGYLLYCIGTQRRVDLPLAVFRGMAKLHTASHNAALPFLGVISKLLVDMGKLAEPDEDIIIPKSKIDRFTLKKFRSHITAVELDDDGEGDTAGPPGVGPLGVGPSVVADSDEGNSRDDQIGEVAINVSFMVSIH
ncbi:hypothetical protein MRB53_002156 [Persea americana]|uniref:Uncharacterized protein n=1 Tax=Persea americana TaxID=3435 RepID=A0ACC2MU22_PERAE|nr:hypothetical protein MRB53_002156 [Persea americana]